MMRHVVILADGMADWHVEALGGATPLQYAHTPNFDRLARLGRSGMLRTIPDGYHPGSEVANSSILGYDQRVVYEGRGPLEAASIGVALDDDDLALRCNIVSIDGDIIKNHSCGRLETAEGDRLIKYLDAHLGNDRIHFHTGVQYRHLLVIKGGDKHIRFTPPHDIPLKPWHDYLPEPECPEAAETCNMITDLICKSQAILRHHPLNIRREENGQDPANSIWPWGGGYRPRMKTLSETYPGQIRRGSVITAVDLIRGIGRYAGLRAIHVEGATGLWDTNYRGKAKAAIEALREGDDFVYIHVEACDEAGHDGDMQLKLRCIENIDRYIAGPVMEYAFRQASTGDPISVSLLPDHPTPVGLRTHTAEPVPFTIWHPGIQADPVQTFDEDAARYGAYGMLEGDQFIRTLMDVRQTNQFRNEIL